jgi:hypothetical protein
VGVGQSVLVGLLPATLHGARKAGLRGAIAKVFDTPRKFAPERKIA